MADNVSKLDREGNILHEWVIPEYAEHERSRGWFIVAGIVSLFLIVISLWTPNWFFDKPNFLLIIIIALTAITVLVRHYNEPPLLAFVIYEDGIAIGERFYPYRELDCFWIIYEPPVVKTLYFHFASAWRPRLPVPLEDQNPITIRQTLLKFLREDLERESEPTSDALSRVLKI